MMAGRHLDPATYLGEVDAIVDAALALRRRSPARTGGASPTKGSEDDSRPSVAPTGP